MGGAFALRAMIYRALNEDPGLTALIGAGRVHDDLPDGLNPPYVLIGAHSVRLAGADAREIEEHRIAIAAWSAARGHGAAAQIAARIRSALQSPAGIGDPYVLANFEFVSAAVGEAPGPDGYLRAELVFRALVEMR